MTAITLDPQPDSPECFRIDATTAPRNASPSDDRPRLVCEWKRTADGQLTGAWTLRDANLASVPELSPEEMTLQPDVRTFKDRTTIAGQDRFLVGLLRPPRQVRTVLGMAAAVVFLGLAAAGLSRSTTVNSHQTSRVSVATTRVVPAVAQSAMMDNVPSVIDPDTEFFLGAADGSVGAWAAHLTTPESLKIGECLQQTYRQRSLPLESLSNLLQRRKANDLDYDEPHD